MIKSCVTESRTTRKKHRQFQARKMSLEHRHFRFHKAQPLREHQQFQLHRVPRLHQQHKLFNIRRPDQRTSKCKHLSRTRIPTKQAADGKNGGTNSSLVSDIFASQILMTASMLFTFMGENKFVSCSYTVISLAVK